MAWYFCDSSHRLDDDEAEHVRNGEVCPDCGRTDVAESPDGMAFACNYVDEDGDPCGCQWTEDDVHKVAEDEENDAE